MSMSFPLQGNVCYSVLCPDCRILQIWFLLCLGQLSNEISLTACDRQVKAAVWLSVHLIHLKTRCKGRFGTRRKKRVYNIPYTVLDSHKHACLYLAKWGSKEHIFLHKPTCFGPCFSSAGWWRADPLCCSFCIVGSACKVPKLPFLPISRTLIVQDCWSTPPCHAHTYGQQSSLFCHSLTSCPTTS